MYQLAQNVDTHLENIVCTQRDKMYTACTQACKKLDTAQFLLTCWLDTLCNIASTQGGMTLCEA